MNTPERSVRADAKLKRLPKEDLDALWALRNPEDRDTEPKTLEQVRGELLEHYDIKVATSTVGEFYRWLKLKRRMDAARDTAGQVIQEWSHDGEAIDEEQLTTLGNKIFMTEAINSGNADAFTMVRRLMLEEHRLRLENEKAQIRAKEKIEAGLDELFKEISGNKRAEKLFHQLKETIRQA